MPDGSSAVRGATTIIELLERYPDGSAARLMAALNWPCAHCAARAGEPLALAAQRHGNPVRATIACFHALACGGPSAAQLEAARAATRRSPDPLAAWRRSAAIARKALTGTQIETK